MYQTLIFLFILSTYRAIFFSAFVSKHYNKIIDVYGTNKQNKLIEIKLNKEASGVNKLKNGDDDRRGAGIY